MVLFLLRGASPDVEVKLGGRSLGVLEADAAASLVTGSEGHLKLAVLAFGNFLGLIGPVLA